MDNHKVYLPQSNSDLVQTVTPEDQFEKHIEEIDQDLRKFELPMGRKEANTLLLGKQSTPVPDTHILDCT